MVKVKMFFSEAMFLLFDGFNNEVMCYVVWLGRKNLFLKTKAQYLAQEP